MAIKHTATAKKPKVPEITDYCVYIGPSIRGVIQYGSIHAGKLDEVLKDIKPAIDKYPLIAGLVVTGERLSVSRIQVKTPGNAIYETYRKLSKVIALN